MRRGIRSLAIAIGLVLGGCGSSSPASVSHPGGNLTTAQLHSALLTATELGAGGYTAQARPSGDATGTFCGVQVSAKLEPQAAEMFLKQSQETFSLIGISFHQYATKSAAEDTFAARRASLENCTHVNIKGQVLTVKPATRLAIGDEGLSVEATADIQGFELVTLNRVMSRDIGDS